MCHWIKKLPLSVQRILNLLLVVFHFVLAESASNELLPKTGDGCPGDVLIYNCTVVGSRNTIWSGSAFDCETKMNEIILRHSQFSLSGSSGTCSGGAISARSLRAINGTFFSQLNVTLNSDMNNKTIQCAHSSDSIVSVGMVTLYVASAPPTQLRLSEIRPGELTFNWRATADHLAGLIYSIDSSCGSCPNMTDTTTVTCSDLNVSTTLTTCTFSVSSVACDMVGAPTLPVIVTLGVPDAPSATIIPQYSLNDGQSLTAIIVCVERNVTSFRISDTISGSVTSYSTKLLHPGNNSVMQRMTATACVGAIYELTVDIPSTSTVCSTSREVDIVIAAANKLGLGPPSEPTTIECNNDFVKVEYNPSTTTISCTFENELDTSKKSCHVRYGTCDKQTSTQNATITDGSPSTLVIKLTPSAASSIECYVVTASNATFTVMVKGKIETQTDAIKSGVIVGSVIGGIILLAAVIVTVIVIVVLKRGRTAEEDITKEFVMVEVEREVKVEEPPSQPMTDAQINKIIKNEYEVVEKPDATTAVKVQ